MFDVAPTEFMLVAVIALLVIGPKDLPKVMRVVGNWVGKARRVANHFRAGMDEMIRQSELEEMEKKWAAENERIMRDHPAIAAPEPDIVPEDNNSPPPFREGVGGGASPSGEALADRPHPNPAPKGEGL